MLVGSQGRTVAIWLLALNVPTVLLHAVAVATVVLCRRKMLAESVGCLPLLALYIVETLHALLLVFPIGAAFHNGWFWGGTACQMYATADMLAATARILLISFIALDRYASTCTPDWESWRTETNYGKSLAFLFSVAVIWALIPLFTWGSYAPTVSNVTCMINYTRYDKPYTYYLTATFVFLFLLPFCGSAALYYTIYDYGKRMDSAENRMENEGVENLAFSVRWAPQNHVGKISLGCIATVYMSYIGYGLIILNPFGIRPIPDSLDLFSLVLSKSVGLLHAIFYFKLNPETFRYSRKLIFRCDVDISFLIPYKKRNKQAAKAKISKYDEVWLNRSKTTDKTPGSGYRVLGGRNSIIAAYNTVAALTHLTGLTPLQHMVGGTSNGTLLVPAAEQQNQNSYCNLGAGDSNSSRNSSARGGGEPV